jgi:hypothetical protein
MQYDTDIPTPPDDTPSLAQLSPDNREVSLSASDGVDLDGEIRLLRLVLAYLSGDHQANHRAIMPIVAALVRAAGLQVKTEDGSSEIEQALLDAADAVLSEEEER